jgi:hypothetical protein
MKGHPGTCKDENRLPRSLANPAESSGDCACYRGSIVMEVMERYSGFILSLLRGAISDA